MQLTQPATTCSMTGHGRLPNQHGRAGETLCDAGGLPELSGGAPLAFRICLPPLRIGKGMGDGERLDSLRGLPPPAVRHRRHGVSRHAHAVAHMVPGDVARLREQERDERAEPAEAARPAELQHGLAVPAQAAPGHGASGAGVPFGGRGGGRNVRGRAERGEKRARRVRQADRVHRGGSARPCAGATAACSRGRMWT